MRMRREGDYPSFQVISKERAWSMSDRDRWLASDHRETRCWGTPKTKSRTGKKGDKKRGEGPYIAAVPVAVPQAAVRVGKGSERAAVWVMEKLKYQDETRETSFGCSPHAR